MWTREQRHSYDVTFSVSLSCEVVWKPGDPEVVERPLAEWRFCVLRGIPGRRQRRTGLGRGKSCSLIGRTLEMAVTGLMTWSESSPDRKTWSSSVTSTECSPWTRWPRLTLCPLRKKTFRNQNRSASCLMLSHTARWRHSLIYTYIHTYTYTHV